MKFIHISDVHLGVRPDIGKIWSDNRTEEIHDTFRKILDMCEDDQIELLLIAGDLFDHQPDTKDLKDLDILLRKLSYTKTIIIAGEHDYIEANSAWENFEFLSDTVVLPRDRASRVIMEDLNVCVTGFSYGKPEYKERILERITPVEGNFYNILLGHGGDKTHMPFSKEKLASLGFDYVALGHIHKPSHLIENKMAFAGSLEPIDYTETGRRGYILGEAEISRDNAAENVTKITWIPFNKRSYLNMAIEVDEDYTNAMINEAVEKEIKELGNQNIYRILIKGKVSSNLQMNLSELTRRYNINEIINKTQCDIDMEEVLSGNTGNIIGRFADAMSDEDSIEDVKIRNKAKRYGIEALLGVGDK